MLGVAALDPTYGFGFFEGWVERTETQHVCSTTRSVGMRAGSREGITGSHYQ